MRLSPLDSGSNFQGRRTQGQKERKSVLLSSNKSMHILRGWWQLRLYRVFAILENGIIS